MGPAFPAHQGAVQILATWFHRVSLHGEGDPLTAQRGSGAFGVHMPGRSDPIFCARLKAALPDAVLVPLSGALWVFSYRSGVCLGLGLTSPAPRARHVGACDAR